MKDKKVFVVGDNIDAAKFIENYELVDSIEKANIVLFTGGEDISPSMYGCRRRARTSYNEERDKKESTIFKTIKPEQLVIGVGRGAQLCCVMNGGILVQNCSNHNRGVTHMITNQSETYYITSTHHQMMYPYNLGGEDFTVLFKSNLAGSYNGEKFDIDTLINYGEPEIVIYHKKENPRCLAIQGHPETMGSCGVVIKINQLINKYLEK